MRIFLHVLIFLGLALGLGTLANLAGPKRIPWVEAWSNRVETKAEEAGIRLASLEEVAEAIETGSMIILDARRLADYDAGHIPTAMCLPELEFETFFPEIQPMLMPDFPILVYCSGKECDESLNLCVLLQEQGFENLVLFAGGMKEWEAAGKPIE